MRRRGFESHPVLFSLIDNSASVNGAHVVVVAYCLAMAEARVRLPLGTSLRDVGEPGSIRLLREQEIAGSNPAIPIRSICYAREYCWGQLLTSIPVWPNGKAAPC
jgi:hypothetical protein